jgi:hypothetical protein
MNKKTHYTAQVCKNGHLITQYYEDSNSQKSFCDECGEPTIIECENCGTNIQGDRIEGLPSLRYTVPKYCYNCGDPFVWTQRSLEAAEELADELQELDKDEKETLKLTISDLTKGGPKVQVAKNRFKRIMGKVGRESAEAMKSILVDIISETVKKSIYGE